MPGRRSRCVIIPVRRLSLESRICVCVCAGLIEFHVFTLMPNRPTGLCVCVGPLAFPKLSIVLTSPICLPIGALRALLLVC